MLERISKITQRWFLCEEALFIAFCTHRLAENNSMLSHIRVGNGMIEINPNLCDDISDAELEETLRVEVIRILLKHPYERQPDGCSIVSRARGSNCVVSDNYTLKHLRLDTPKDYDLPPRQTYEFYARNIEHKMNPQGMSSDSDSDDDFVESNDEDSLEDNDINEATKDFISMISNEILVPADLALNWQQDDFMTAIINETIANVHSWGSLAGNLEQMIIASTKAKIDYRKILAGFRASIISQKRKLTRMRPNRRSGFEALGSQSDFSTSLIIGVDCSGSISDANLCDFYTTINRFFSYGIKTIDAVQFDVALGEVTTLDKASRKIKVVGRGGTSFQPFFDYVAEHPEYDGALIYTDGYADQPVLPEHLKTKICWILPSESFLPKPDSWMREIGRICVIENNS
ncbi:MAG: VWA-like domain-containing protein [Muribaculaceae bacterium]